MKGAGVTRKRGRPPKVRGLLWGILKAGKGRVGRPRGDLMRGDLVRLAYYYRVMNCWARTVAGRLVGSRGSAAGGASARPRGDGAGSRSTPGCAARGAREELRGR